MATVDGERDTNFTKVVAMVTDVSSPLSELTINLNKLPVPEEANLEWQSFGDTHRRAQQ